MSIGYVREIRRSLQSEDGFLSSSYRPVLVCFAFTPQMNHTRVWLEPDRDHLDNRDSWSVAISAGCVGFYTSPNILCETSKCSLFKPNRFLTKTSVNCSFCCSVSCFKAEAHFYNLTLVSGIIKILHGSQIFCVFTSLMFSYCAQVRPSYLIKSKQDKNNIFVFFIRVGS